jgi:unsaturated rhamnogalacturonyl hydrolase
LIPAPANADLAARLTAAADRLVRHPFRCWFYGDSIGFEGLLAATELLGDDRYAAFAHGYLRAWAARDTPRREDDNTAPGNVLCALAERHGDGELLAAALRLADHLAARRTVGGVALTFEDAKRSLREPYGRTRLPAAERQLLADPGGGTYVDCLHFDPPFHAHLGRLTGEQRWADRAVEEALGYADLLVDRQTGLYHHFWLERTSRAYAPGWGRGQGWALLGLLDVVGLAPAGTPGFDRVARLATSLAEAVLGWQRPDGAWPAVMQLPRSGPESSTAAFMAAAFVRGIRLGIFPRATFGPAADAAWASTLGRLDEHGLLADVSAAVYSSTALGHYARVPLGFDVPWGQGPVLVAAAERVRSGLQLDPG